MFVADVLGIAFGIFHKRFRKMQLLFIEHDFRLGLGLFLSQGDFTGSRLQAQLPVGGP